MRAERDTTRTYRLIERWRRLHTVGQVRIVFAGLAFLAVGGQIPQVAGGAHRFGGLPVPVACGVTLLVIWWMGVRAGRFPGGVLFVEVLALAGFSVGFDDTQKAIGPVFTVVFFRCMYGSHAAAGGRAIAYSGVLLGVFAWSPVDVPSGVMVFVPVSVAVLTVVMRVLATCLERIAQASELSANLARTAGAMISVPTERAVLELCEVGGASLAPEGRVYVSVDGQRAPDDRSEVLRFDLGTGDGVALYVASKRPLSASRREALRTLAAQATTALEGLELRTQLAYRASHDGLTGLPNRTTYTNALTAALSSGNRCAALFIDLDDFKAVNDTLGHAAGDALLVQVAGRLVECLRSADVAARLGGDEFAILVQGLADVPAMATSVAARLLSALEEPFTLVGTPFYMRCSIGVAVDGQLVAVGGTAVSPVEPRSDADVHAATADLLRNADIAMYVAKAKGKNRFEIFAPHMAAVVANDVDARQELAAALANQEFELHFQPILALPSRQVREVEALIRWRHPDRGLLAPGEFLAVAEQSRMLADIERWVITSACHEAATWHGEHPPAVSVNISPRHLARSWLVPCVEHALAESGLPGHRLVLEITEEALIVDPATAEANLRRCVEMGVRIAVDDFGAGHASLGSLRTLPISTVKMDRSLVADEHGQRVIDAVVELAHALGINVVAEGVETEDELRRVRAGGCDAVQGYLFARPVPASALNLGLAAVPGPEPLRVG